MVDKELDSLTLFVMWLMTSHSTRRKGQRSEEEELIPMKYGEQAKKVLEALLEDGM